MAKKKRKEERSSKAKASGENERSKEEGGQKDEEDEGKDSVAEWLKSIVVAFVLFLVIRTFLLQTFVITSGSMRDTLVEGDMLVANRAAIGARIPGTHMRIPGYSRPKRGDVWVFDPHHEDSMKLVKRLVGLPLDTLRMRNGVLFVNGEQIDEPYLNAERGPDERSPSFEWQRNHLAPGVDARTYSPTRQTWGPLVVPEDHYFMMGDNRDSSLDSRYWGPLAAWRLEGRAVFIYFSYAYNSYRPFPAIREIHWERLGQGIR